VIRYAARRLVVAVVLLLALTLLTFLVYSAIPSNPGRGLLPFQHPSNADLALANHALGVDRPVLTQWGDWLSHAVRGDLGFSWGAAKYDFHGHASGDPVTDLLLPATSVSLSIVLGGLLLMLLTVVPLAALSAHRPGSAFDRLTATFLLIGISTHPLVVGILLQAFASNRLSLLPAQGYCPVHWNPKGPSASFGTSSSNLTPYCSGVGAWAQHLVLPWITFALFFAALYVRVLRASLLETLEEPYVATARAKGASEPRVLLRHALPNALRPILTMTGMEAGTAIGVLIYIEIVFGLPGIGRLSVAALNGDAGYDRPMIAAIVLFVGIAVFGINLLVDLLYPLVDRRVGQAGTPHRDVAAVGPSA
jgi:peptide/nickel transport system permease protein